MAGGGDTGVSCHNFSDLYLLLSQFVIEIFIDFFFLSYFGLYNSLMHIFYLCILNWELRR